ncbi:MAG: amino acid permease [Melioribacteraceae bacterium]|nr:amino acid permease [Melioribacteraceae bacterium]
MISAKKSNGLKKELNVIGVFAIAFGTTISGGFFLLPGLAASQAGSAIVIAYLLAVIPLFPAMFSIIELSTAMPRAGGLYYFLDRTLGPYFGTIGGIGTWLALILKVAFALIGMGAYISLFYGKFEIVPVAIALAVILGLLNIFGAKQSGRFQILLVIGLLIILIPFLGSGLFHLDMNRLQTMFDTEFQSILATTGLVFISYAGITKVASLSEEVVNPEKNLPKGIILALSIAVVVYFLGTLVMVGVVPIEKLAGDLTPAASVADLILGKIGVFLISIAAILSFVSVANAGILSSSRYPLAMSRDHLVPRIFRQLVGKGIPLISIITTVGVIVLILLFLNPLKIAKLASAFQLLMFALVSLAVIVMRESKIESYDPGYKSPFYPWMQIIGIISPFILIFYMGALSILFTFGLILVSSLWFIYYGKKRVARTGAIYHIFERLGRSRYQGLDSELRGILKEKGLRQEDPFEDIITRSIVLDLKGEKYFQEVVDLASYKLAQIIPHTSEEIRDLVLQGTRVGATPVTHGVALPHFRSDRVKQTQMVLVRAKNGVKIRLINPITQEEEEEHEVSAIFFLISPENNPAQHLRILAQIAGRVDDDNFVNEWNTAKSDQELKEVLLYDEKFLSLVVTKENKTSYMIQNPIHAINLPKGCLVALLQRYYPQLFPTEILKFWKVID